MDAYFDNLIARGMTQQEIFEHMIGKQDGGGEPVEQDEGEEGEEQDIDSFDPSKFNLDPALYSEFTRMLEKSKAASQLVLKQTVPNELAIAVIKIEYCKSVEDEAALVIKVL